VTTIWSNPGDPANIRLAAPPLSKAFPTRSTRQTPRVASNNRCLVHFSTRPTTTRGIKDHET
jgi:hypothetical protein